MSETNFVFWDPLNHIYHDTSGIYYRPAPGEDGYDDDTSTFKVGSIINGKIYYFKGAGEYIAKIGIKPGTKLRTTTTKTKTDLLAPGSY